MATYLKRTSKLFDLSQSQASAEMNLRDVICPVCRGILIEPVTLPCTHNLCLRCLKCTFEHNSLSCPLCRVRVGSWLRNATKSETLVNSELWELIRSRFPKEVSGKHDDDETDIKSHQEYAPKILSAAGEIRREYEMQLQIAEEERRRESEAERIASEAVIRKLQEEEKQYQLRLVQDQLLAKTLAKKQFLDTDKGLKYFECRKISNENMAQTSCFNYGTLEPSNLQDALESRQSNLNLLSKIHTERLISSGKAMGSKSKDTQNLCCQQSVLVHNPVTLKHQSVTITTNKDSLCSFVSEPSCSNSKIYGTQSEEELRVPSDVLSSNKKSLGVEVCVTTSHNYDKRIGSAESAGSHDSINQEIHHFKPIKAMPRTPLRLSQDGKTIDPKLIRVTPIVKRISNAVPKPPSPSNIKRMLGCSWSAFRGRVIQDLKLQASESEWKLSGTQSLQICKLSKSSETARKIDLAQDISFDNNKNYAKSINRIMNGTKVSKKLILDDESEIEKSKTWKAQVKNGCTGKNKKLKNSSTEKKILNDVDMISSSSSVDPAPESSSALYNIENDDGAAMVNIAERIKRRKVAQVSKNQVMIEKIGVPRETRSKTLTNKNNVEESTENLESTSKSKIKVGLKTNKKSKRLTDNTGKKNQRPTTRKSARSKSNAQVVTTNLDEDDDEINDDFDVIVIKEQERMEHLLLQEQKDFELAQRLQAKFNEMESVGCRTRGSKRAHEASEIELSLDKMKINGKQLSMNNTVKSSTAKLRRKQRHD